MTAFHEDVQRLNLGEIVELFVLDLTPLGGTKYYFTPTTDTTNNNIVTFQGIDYVPVDIMAEGFETSGRGTLPTPTVRIANTTRAITGLLQTYGDMVGAKIVRLRTLSKYLDNQPTADPSAFFPPDIYFVEQKTGQTKLLVEFKLSAVIDLEGQKIPRRQVVRDYCSHTYRRFNPNNNLFDYSGVSCPYAAAETFDIDDKEVNNNSKDVCAKRLTSCQARFGRGWLPYRGFPGAGRLS
jgi:lambda family phage minor tail protein L